MKNYMLSLLAFSLIVNFSGDTHASLSREDSNTTEDQVVCRAPLSRTCSFSNGRGEDRVYFETLSATGDFVEGLYAALEAGDFQQENREGTRQNRSDLMAALKVERKQWALNPDHDPADESPAYKSDCRFKREALKKEIAYWHKQKFRRTRDTSKAYREHINKGTIRAHKKKAVGHL